LGGFGIFPEIGVFGLFYILSQGSFFFWDVKDAPEGVGFFPDRNLSVQLNLA
jgi:hypothetical protein